MPPMTVVSPSFTSTSVSASRFWMEGWLFAPVSCGFGVTEVTGNVTRDVMGLREAALRHRQCRPCCELSWAP